jgi:hypothetical protein
MAQTETRPGFRLPWTAERGESGAPPEDAVEESPADGDTPVAEETETPQMIDTTDAPEAAPAPTGTATSGRRPTKFLADLSHAMQVAAETARDETMARFESEAKTAVEEVNAKAADEAAGLRRQADDDVAAIRDWSKAEIARIRGETEARIASRKIDLDEEIEAHAGVVSARVERVGTAVTAFQAEMGEFFERLLAEEDPTRIATMAETMPDPPSLAEVVASMVPPSPAALRVVREAAAEERDAAGAAEALAAAEAYRGLDHGSDAEASSDEAATTDAESTEANAEATTTEASDITEGTGSTEGAAEASADGATAEPDFAAAEAEALAFTGDLGDEPSATPAEASAGLPAEPEAHLATSGGRGTTRVVVLGLVSVASIATFKRSLGRVPGVSAIGVASGPDGEFVFTVSHDSELSLADAITALPGFEAKITSQNADGLEVAAHDPDAAS